MRFESKNNPALFTFSRHKKLISRSLAASLMLIPFSASTPKRHDEVARAEGAEILPQHQDPSCGVTEVQAGLTAEYTRYLTQTYDREITVLDSNFVQREPRYRFLPQIQELVPREEGETERSHAERVVSITRRLADLHLPPNVQNIEDSIGAIRNARERYLNEPIFNETILFISGAVTRSRDSGQSVYATPQVMRRLSELGRVRHFSGLLSQMENCEWATVDSLETARDGLLTAIETTPTPITVLIRAHGSENSVELGNLNAGEEVPHTVTLEAVHLARAFAARYANTHLAARAKNRHDTVIFDDCYILPLATSAFFGELERIAREENRDIPTPSVITASEVGQLAFRGQLLQRLLFENRSRPPTFGMLYPDNDLLGNRRNNSNATVVVRDRRGRPLQIG